MATLNTSSDGPSITRNYQAVVDAPPPSGAAAQSPTYGQWVVYSVQAPLMSAFQQDSSKESVLKVFRTGEGELIDLIDEFSEGKIQFAFVKVKDPNTSLPKNVLIAWCGEGVPERTKGYFTSHLATVSKLLHGYHVQVTARTDNDLSPEAIVRKVSDSSGSRYSGDSAPAVAPGAPPPIASKPVFTPSRVGGGPTNFTPLGSRSRGNVTQANVDEEGWGEDAPQVTRSQIQRVEPAYKPTKVNMAELTSQRGDTTSSNGTRGAAEAVSSDVVKGGYQPIGKVDIAALRREAKEQGSTYDDRPNAVKGSYEPVGKVDIAAIRARAQPNQNDSSTSSYISPSRTGNSAQSNDSDSQSKSLSDRSAAFAPSERLTSMPKPKVSNKFGSGASSLTGTRAPTPGGFENKPVPAVSAPIGTASKTFADEGGKTPAQQWAEKKARQRGDSGPVEQPRPAVIASQTSGDGGWESGYSGKKWGAVQTTTTGKSATSAVSQEKTGEEARRDEPASLPAGGVSAIRDRFKGTAPMTGTAPEDREAPAPPPMDFSSKPNAGTGRAVPVPGLPTRSQPANKFGEDKAASEMPPPAQPPRSDPPSPEMRPSSPIRIAQPVARTEEAEMEPTEDLHDVPQMPLRSMAQQAPAGDDLEKDTQGTGADPARATAQATVTSPVEPAAPNSGGKRALAQYDYEKAEDNELELKEGEYVNNIDMVDEDWWMGENSRGETGLFPSNYVELVEDEPASMDQSRPVAEPGAPAAAPAVAPSKQSQSALAQYDYEAAEENELSFPDGAKITNVEFPDEDWWYGEYNGKAGLFPANYVELDR